MDSQNKLESFVSQTLALSSRMFQVFTKSIIQNSTQAFKNLHLRSELSKMTDLCSNNKEVCAGVSIVLLTIFLEIRKTRNQKKDREAEKQMSAHHQQTTWAQKSTMKNSNAYPMAKFMDEEGSESVDEPSTGTEPMRKMIVNKRGVVLDEQSDDEEEREDKLFFEMFNTYRKAEGKEE